MSTQLRLIRVTLAIFAAVVAAEEYLGVPVGTLSNPAAGIQGNIYLANATVIHIHGFAIQKLADEEEIHFVLSTKEDIVPIRRIYKQTSDPATGEPAILAIKKNINFDVSGVRLYAFLPDQEQISRFTTFGVFSAKSWKYLASVRINQSSPEPFCCLTNPKKSSAGIIGHHYDAGTGPIEISDSKTIVFKAFNLDGVKAPDAWIFAGNDSMKPVTRKSGRKAMVIGRDTPLKQCSLKDHYIGDNNLEARLLRGQDVYSISFISIFCYKYDVDFGHIDVRLDPATRPVPLFVPPPLTPESKRAAAAQNRHC